MKACIISGGHVEAALVKAYLSREPSACILAADHGLVFCHEQHIRPDYIMGDFDSTDPDIVRQYREDGSIPIETFRPEKDLTDTDIAIQKAISLAPEEVVLFGATGTRFDHSLSNVYNLYSFCRAGIPASIEDAHNRITLLDGGAYRLPGEKQYGDRISLFPFGGEVTGLTLEGVKYPVTDATLTLADGGRFVSNEITGTEAVITWKKGILLLMETSDTSRAG